ncbi:zinc finger protein JAGGED-like [Hibiscus syriacus]|uniref:zinc finger protein JAGGED-like n=1 Tax=Hibiscus syriacus TaxID=106335 RepID=UPI0019242136|nr:zinc finger protein JAGGED-like [Hibiscus syriacus]
MKDLDHQARRRPEKNPLDLNFLPDEYTRDGKQVSEEGSSSGYRTKKNRAKDGKDDECGKVYECRFCSLKFCKSQALGGHMNRHRQERETETLNRARQLVFGNDNLTTTGHLGYAPSSYHPSDPTQSFISVCPPTLFSGSSPRLVPPALQPPQPYVHLTHDMNDYYLGQVVRTNGSLSHSQYHQQSLNYLGASDSNYTCVGTPAGNRFGHGLIRRSDLVGPRPVGGAGFRDVTQQHLDYPTTNPFEDGF